MHGFRLLSYQGLIEYWMAFCDLNIPTILMAISETSYPSFLFSNCRHWRRWRHSLKRDVDGIVTNDGTFGTIIRAIICDGVWSML